MCPERPHEDRARRWSLPETSPDGLDWILDLGLASSRTEL